VKQKGKARYIEGSHIEMTIDERIEALTMNLKLLARSHEDTNRRVTALLTATERDVENIRGLARIAELHEHRLTDLEGGQS
jgi:hypothetical protein